MIESPELLKIENWQPLTVDETIRAMKGTTVPWWIAGGWAIDLFLGRRTRQHADTEGLVLRRDQQRVQEHLQGWRGD